MPQSTADLRSCESEYAVAGFPGCIGSTDATHIPLDKVTAAFRQAHIGYKMGSDATTRTYNLTVNHRRQILHTTTGHPGRWNDKALIRFDSFMSDLRDGAFDEMVDFTLKRGRKDDTGTVTTGDEVEDVTIKGAYVIVDNGYLRWPTTIPPMKDTCNRSELRFSQWLEALRKDVECTFGILKGRWRILKTGIRVHNTEASDNIWMTCCALHNHLLDVDGLSHKWDDGVPSSYENDDGEFQDEDIPAAIRRLVDTIGNEGHRLRTFDSSRFGFQMNHEDDARDCDDDDDDDDDGDILDNDARFRSGTSVKSIEFNRFRAMLIENFNIAFHENKLKWPKRFAKNTEPVPILPG
ncbi:Plant transposon protein [Fragilaria crotonensis]|nr:Plant transposon protein [Fragilaria crotonensis]